ncbi:MAG TPA: exonuclease domain-containing protein [bacterium]|nr:exonuclease domain-containing protein [bacterium]
MEPPAIAIDSRPPLDLIDYTDLGLPPLPPTPGLPVYRHPSRAALRGYAYLRNMGGRADAAALLRKALAVRARLPAGLEPVARAMFASTRGFQEVAEGHWAVEVEAAALQDLAEGRFVVFDLETTGGKPPSERITEIGAVRIEHGRITDTFQTLVNPGKPIPPFVARLTGITDKSVRRAPRIEKVLPRFLEFIEGHVLIAHDVFQDLRFIDQEIMTTYGGVLAMPVLDTLTLAKELVDPEIGFSLRKVAEHLGIDAGSSHRALDDARVTAEMFLRFMQIKGQGAWAGLLDGYAVRR